MKVKIKIILLLAVFNVSQIFSQDNLPKISLKDIQGKRIDIDAIDTNKVTVFSFWATWCIPCINELDAISEIYQDWQNEMNVKIIAVSIDDTRSTYRVKPMVKSKNWEFEILFDTNQEFKRAINATSIPYLIIVKNSKIIHTQSGYTPGSEIELYEKIKEFASKN